MQTTLDLSDAGHVSNKANSLVSAEVDGNSYVFVASWGDNRVLAYSVGSNGTLTLVDEMLDSGALSLKAASSITAHEIAGTTYLFVGSGMTDGIQVLSVASDGSMTAVDQVFDDATLAIAGANSLTVTEIAGNSYLIVGSYNDHGVQVFSIASDGSLTDAGQVYDDSTLALLSTSSVTTMEISGTTYLFTTGYADDGVQVFSVGSDGSLTDAGQVYDDTSLLIDSARDTVIKEIGGTPYLFVAGRGDHGVQVFSVASDGSLTATSQISDDTSLALNRPIDIKLEEIGGETYLFVVGKDDNGVQVLSVASDGSLTDAGQVVDDATLFLDGARDTSFGVVNNNPYLFVASGNPEKGVHTFSVEPTITGTSATDILSGTDVNEKLLGLDGNDHLSGHGGADTLDGGSGNDTAYYTTSSAGINIDLALSTASGGDAEGDILISIENITASNYADTIVAGGSDNGVFRGLAGDDTLHGGSGRNILHGEANNDLLIAYNGDDELYGGTGNDTLDGGFGDDVLTGDTGSDVFVFAADWGADKITDFSNGDDLIDLSSTSLQFADLTITQFNADTIITVASGDSIILENFTATNIGVDDFAFI